MAAPLSSQPPRESYEITSPRLIIRTALESDAEGLHQFLTTPENFPHMPFNAGVTVEKLRASIGRWKDMQAQGINAFLIIVLRETGEIIGQGSYNCFDWVEAPGTTGAGAVNGPDKEKKKKLTDFGVLLDHRHWRKGLGAEAICSMVNFAAEELGCSLFRTETAEENEPWKAVIRSLGLKEFETFGPQSYDEKVNGWVWKFDADDWQKVKAKKQENGKWPL
ncbi:hypothetical protein N0V93_004396 [Gnomoniopsis smithogilvyi]|uniref:N-acetyltransferase domain-containing protein n=1 Tax=Gnomoniopsis smithogilvyi TaxID=1191159 RepID=A0A9W9CW59_9PEZI|nr:hypothetical protein N0V93_004396 [Gnomoniopsis smithogilvyi]